jgi:hypothetical protein
MASFISLEHGASMKSGNRLPKMRNKFPESRKMTLRSPRAVNWDGLQRVHMQNVAGWQNMPVRVLR